MTLKEVEAVVGTPKGGSWYWEPEWRWTPWIYYYEAKRPPRPWEGESVSIRLRLDFEGLVQRAEMGTATTTWADWLQGWRDWAGL